MSYEIDNQDPEHDEPPEELEDLSYTLPELKSLPSEKNIAALLPDEVLDAIGLHIVEGYEDDEMSRKMWLEKYKKGMEIAMQTPKDRTWPWPKASNVKFPLMSIAALQFHARAYPALVPTDKVVSAKVVGKDPHGLKLQQADRVETYMNYQILEQMDSWDEDMDRLLITLPITGTEFKKTYYDPSCGYPMSEHVFGKDVVINYFAKDMASALRVTHIMEMSRNEFEENERAGLFLDVDDDLLTVQSRDDETTRLKKENQGLQEPRDDKDVPLNILECHTWYDLDKDGYAEPYIITVLKDNRKVCRITARFQPDNITMADGMVQKIVPDEYFTKYIFVPSPDGGIYGMGFIHLVGALNKAVDTIINQLIDAGTLSNLQSGFLSRSFRQRGGNMQFQPGEWKVVNASGQDLQAGIFPLPVREPSAVLFSLLGMLVEVGQRITNTTDMMVGENPGQNQKATTTQAVVEAGMKVFTAVYKRIRRALGKEFYKLYKLNGIHFNKKEYEEILDIPEGGVDDLEKDYDSRNYKICPSADPNASSSSTKLMKAQALVQLIPLGIDRTVVLKRLLDALEIDNIEEFKLDQLQQQPQVDPKVALAAQEFQWKVQKDSHDMQLADKEQQRKEAETQIKADKVGVDAHVRLLDSNNKSSTAMAVAAQKNAQAGGGNE